jgi:hypothetical protein
VIRKFCDRCSEDMTGRDGHVILAVDDLKKLMYSRHWECINTADKLGIERSTIINRSVLSRRTVYLILGEAGR